MCCCISMRGLAFFGASVQTCSGLVDMGNFVDTVVALVANAKAHESLESLSVSIAKLVTSGLGLPISLLVLVGVDKECVPLLTWPPITYFFLQVLGFLLRIKYGVMVLKAGVVSWKKLPWVLPATFEQLVHDSLFGFMFTTFHLVVLFFYVQKIETSVGGQVLDPSPGYSVTFFPHPIQPPRLACSPRNTFAGGRGDSFFETGHPSSRPPSLRLTALPNQTFIRASNRNNSGVNGAVHHGHEQLTAPLLTPDFVESSVTRGQDRSSTQI
ncbi:unnamed protein product [Allacma fusca]|uniref:Uncharacterized protein n=1 Tax=Allacma fusca TaxID=39272 RepID=A0A8J2L4J4_9HEXA|nr:unnamed protein product [Allacma fusca]